MGSWGISSLVVCWLMASCILCRGGACLSLLLVLLLFLLHSGQPVASTDESSDHRKINDTLAIVCCPSAGASITEAATNITATLSSGESRVLNVTCNSLSHNHQCAECVFENYTLWLFSGSSCTGSEPVENLAPLSQTNDSVTLHWNHSNCCINANVAADITGLLAGRSYNMTVHRIWNGSCSQEKAISVATRPSPVLKVKIISRTVNSLEIGWTLSVNNCDTYAFVDSPPNTHMCMPNIDNSSFLDKNPYNMSDLKAGVTYTVVVWAFANNICSIPTCINATTAPNKPSDVSVNGTPYSTHNFSISWVRPQDQNEAEYQYLVIWAKANESTNQPMNQTTNGSSCTLYGLEPANLYRVDLSSQIKGVSSANANVLALTAPLPPTNFDIRDINQTVAVLSWKPPPSFSHVKLCWQKMPTGPGGNKTYSKSDWVPVDGTTDWVVSVDMLTPGANYTFIVVSVATETTVNQSMDSRKVPLGTSTKPAQVGRVRCWPLNQDNSLQVSWRYPPDAGVTAFQVSGFDGEIDAQTNTVVVVKNLHPGRKYQIWVSSFWYNLQERSDATECSIVDEGAGHAGVVIGALCLVLLFLLILGLLLFYFRRRGKSIFWKPKSAKQSLRVAAPVPVSDFSSYCSEHLSDSAFGFAQEYQQLQDVGTEQPWSVAQQPGNQDKNRYSNVLPYDNSRVLLTAKPGDPNSDYINASYLPGYKSAKEFIAAQGPLPATINDFWRMIWEQRVNTLVMLTKCVENGRVKCERYWPLDYTPCVYDDITVSVVTETILPDWTIRDFRMKKVNSNQTDEMEVRLARHYHYTSWPDHQVPPLTSTILRFRDLVREHMEQQEGSGPALVHCSAGVGRTGTFIALDSLLCQARTEGEVGAFAFVQRMRLHRPLMIQTESQYIFLHQCLLDGIQSGPQNDSEKLEHTAVYENITAVQGYEVTRV